MQKSAVERAQALQEAKRKIELDCQAKVTELNIASGQASAECDARLAAASSERNAAIAAVTAEQAVLFAHRTRKQEAIEAASSTADSKLEARKRECETKRDKALAEATVQLTAAHDIRDRLLREAEEAATQVEAKVESKLVGDWYAAVTPLVRAFREVPAKATAEKVARLLWEFDLRAKHELGHEFNEQLLGCAVCDEILKEHREAVNAFALTWDYAGGGVAPFTSAFRQSLEDEVPVMAQKLMLLVDELERVACKCSSPVDGTLARRYAVKRGCAGRHVSTRVLHEFDAEVQREIGRRHAATARRPRTRDEVFTEAYGVRSGPV